MNDNEFLKKYQEEPRKDFEDALYKKITREERILSFPRIFQKPYAIGIGLLFLVFMTMATVPSVRAATLEFFREIAGVNFLETLFPSETLPDGGEVIEHLSFEGLFTNGETPTEKSELIITDSSGNHSAPQISQQEVEDELGIHIKNLSPGSPFNSAGPIFYVFPEIEESGNPGWVGMQTWINPETGDQVFLVIHLDQDDLITVIGPESAEEISINGLPAAIVKGIWSVDPGKSDAVWDSSTGYSIILNDNGISYELSSPTLTKTQLIQIAESMK